MTTDNLSTTGVPTDGAAIQNPAPNHDGLWKVGFATVVFAAALFFVSGCGKQNTRSSRSSGGDSSSGRERRESGGSSGLKAGDTKTFTLPGGVEMEMVYVAPGSFTMGSPFFEKGHREDETQHRVTLTKGFWIGKYPVTQKQWKALVRANGVSFAEGEPMPHFSCDGKGRYCVRGMDTSDFPMENISWDDCKVLIDTLNRNERGERRWSFPTEAQWEFAARGGTKSRGYTYSGGNDLDALGWYHENSGLRRLSDSDLVHAIEKGGYEKLSSNKCRTHSVREKDVGNELGIVGMSGNVCEWCLDWYDKDYYAKSPTDDPCSMASGVSASAAPCNAAVCSSGPAARRVFRGGSCCSLALLCRSACREGHDPSYRIGGEIGFRLCCPAGPRE